MTKNRRIVIHRLGESFRDCTRIDSVPLTEPSEGEVRVRNHFAGVNGVYDQMMCLDRVEHTRVTPPASTGVEAVGVVEAVGPGVAQALVGQAVATVRAGHGYTEFQQCAEGELIAVPEAAPWVLGVIPSGVSALVALEQVGEMRSGQTVCITAAAGGLGSMLTQLAVRAGNNVVAVCGNDDKAAWLKQVGAARVIQYRRESLAEVLAAEYPDGLDLALDSVGGASFDALLEQLAPHGRLVVCGYTADRLPTEVKPQERVYTRLYWKAASVRGFMNWRFAEHAPAARERLISDVQEGRVESLVDQRPFRGLEAVPDAVEHLLAGANLGKVVVDLRA